MASGFSRRMEQEKLLLQLDGVPLVERVIQRAKASNLQEIILVYRSEAVGAIGYQYNLKTIHNPDAHLGQSMSLKLGVKAANPKTQGYMFFVGDQPFLKVDFINELIEAYYQKKHAIILPRYKGQQGNPTIFSSSLKDELLSLEGDEGGRKIIRAMEVKKIKYVDSQDQQMGQDVDTWEMYQQILASCKS